MHLETRSHAGGGGQSTLGTQGTSRERIPRVKEPGKPPFPILVARAGRARLRGSPAVWQEPGRDMLFCLNPPHSLPFPHWPDGATLPTAAAADVSLAGARSSRTHLPGPRHTAAPRGLSGPGAVAANSRARTARGEPRDSGEGTCAEGASFLSPAPRRREPRLEEPRAPARLSRAAAAAAASFFSRCEPWSASGTGPKKSRKSCLPPGERSRSSLCLESQHLQLRLQCVPGDISIGRPAGEGGVARFMSAFGGGSSG